MPFVIDGLVAATFTPMKENGDINLEGIDAYQKYLIDQGVHQVYVNGSTGEGTSLTGQERKSIIEKWVELSRLSGRQMKVLVQVGGTNFPDVIELTKHAASIGVDAISSLTPLYFLPTCVDELVAYCKKIAEAAPSIPFYYYHFPDRTGVKLNMEEFLIKSRHAIPSLRGLKFSSKDMYGGCRCLRTLDANGDVYDILYGCDEQVLSAFASGFKGAVGSSFSLMPRVYQKLKKAVDEGRLDVARECQYKCVDMVKIFFEFGPVIGSHVPAMKVILSELVNVGPVRFPMSQLDVTTKAKLIDRMKSIGFFEWRMGDKKLISKF